MRSGGPRVSSPLSTTEARHELCQLLIFKRCDFVTMYALRLAYYDIWHLAWGHVRLELLF